MILKLNKLFPWHFVILGWVMIPGGLFGILVNPIAGIIFLLLGILFVSSYEGIEIDRDEKKYRMYNSFFFIKQGGWQGYNEFVKLYINPVKTSQEIYSKITTTSTIREVEYQAYLKKNNEEKLYLMADKNRDQLLRHLAPLSEYLDLEIVDNT